MSIMPWFLVLYIIIKSGRGYLFLTKKGFRLIEPAKIFSSDYYNLSNLNSSKHYKEIYSSEKCANTCR